MDRVGHIKKWLVLLIFISTSINFSRGQQPPEKEKDIFSVAAGVQHGFIFAHSKAVQNTKGAHPTGVELLLSWQRNDSAIWSLCNCYPRKGVLLSYYEYDSKILGKGFNAAYLLEPNYKISKNIFFAFKIAAGLSFLSDPFDSLSNPGNQSYSTSLSGYLAVGIGAWWSITDHWWINTSIQYQHISNGGFKQPNKGINYPTAGIAIGYQQTTRTYFKGPRSDEKFWRKNPARWYIALFGMARRSMDEYGNSNHSPLIGLFSQGSKQVGRINALTLGAEIYWDKKLKIQLKADSITEPATKAGILVGNEFILGKFLFSQQLGIYVFDRTPYFDQLYHRWGLLYSISRHWGIGINMKAHRQVADFIDLRVVYAFR
jgi:hypothetical protein